jgi:hypothetical protein
MTKIYRTIGIKYIHHLLLDNEDFKKISKYKFNVAIGKSGHVYALIKIENKFELLHRYLLGITDPKICVDHKNGNTLDNRRKNIRTCSQRENSRNSKVPCNSTTGFKGVSYKKTHGKYRAYIFVDKKQKSLGYYDNPIDAATAYNNAAKLYFGEFARLNKIEGDNENSK